MFPQSAYPTIFDDIVKDLVKEIGGNHKLKPKPKNSTSAFYSNIVKEEGRFIYRSTAPGFKDLDIQLENNKIKIVSNGENILGSRFFDWFTFEASDNIDTENITSTLQDGILEIVLPITEKNRSKKINITR